MHVEVRLRPWQLAVVSITGGAVGALILALLAPGRLESQMLGTIPSFAPLAQQVMPAVVNINTTKTVPSPGRRREGPDPFEQFFGDGFWDRFGGQTQRRARSLGSGFVIDDHGYIVTNHHVVQGADDIEIQFANGTEYKATIVGTDAKTDLALLKIEPSGDLPTVPLGNSDELQIGDWVIAVGNPFGLEHTVTAGIVSARDRVIGAGPYDDFIQTDASINPGNSGGPLFDQHGRVVGIATAIFSRSGGNIGIGFATPVNIARTIVDQLRSDGHVVRGWLGVSIQPLRPDLREALGLGDQEGALVADVFKDTPAEQAGLKRGDVVIGLDGEPVTEPGALSRAVAMMPPGRRVRLTVLRDGKEHEITVTIGRLKDDDQDEHAGAPSDREGNVLADLGLALDDLSDGARKQLGQAEDVEGVLVAGVARGGPADEAGLRPGDIIVQVDGDDVSSPTTARKALGTAKPPILLLVKRRDSTMFLTLSPPGG
jgi:serine protease Do